MAAPAVSAERFFHLDGYNGWGFTYRATAIGPAGVLLTRDGITLPSGPLPAIGVAPAVTAGARARGLAFDRLGRAYAVRDDRRALCLLAGCERDPSPCFDLEPAARRFLRGIAIDARDRVYVARHTRSATTLPTHGGEVLVLRTNPAGEIARIPMVRPAGIAVDGHGRVSVLDAPGTAPTATGVVPLVERIARPGHAIAASRDGALAVATYGASSIQMRVPGGDFVDVPLGRPTLPAIAFSRESDAEGAELVLVGDETSGRIVLWRVEGLHGGSPIAATPVHWSTSIGAWAALAWRGEELFALGRDCRVEPIQLETAGFYERARSFIVGPLDSGVSGTEWHRATASLAKDPTAAVGVAIEILADDDCDSYDPAVADGDTRWESSRDLIAPRQGSPAELAFANARGRYAYLRVTLRGDGRDRPLLRWLRVEYPRDSYLRYLPAVFSEDPSSRSFTARFLSMFEASNVELAVKIVHLRALFEPYAMDPEFFPWLAERLDLMIQRDWSDARTREALARAFWWFARRGTLEAMQHVLELHGGPGIRIIEGHRRRAAFFLGGVGLGCGSVLPGSCTPARAQLDRGVRLGAARLDSRPFMEADAIGDRRGELEIYLPPAIAAQPELVARVTRIARLEAPAGTEVKIVSVASGGRLAYSARLGIDASLGARPPWHLAAEGDAPPRGTSWLGGMLLGRAPGTSAEIALGRSSRLGMDSKL